MYRITQVDPLQPPDGVQSSDALQPMRTWEQIEDPKGEHHDLRLICTICGNEQTCRCSKPKGSLGGFVLHV